MLVVFVTKSLTHESIEPLRIEAQWLEDDNWRLRSGPPMGPYSYTVSWPQVGLVSRPL